MKIIYNQPNEPVIDLRNKTLYESIIIINQYNNFSMGDLSKKSNISRQYLYNIKYKSKVGLKTYTKLARALNIDINILKSLPLQKSKENM